MSRVSPACVSPQTSQVKAHYAAPGRYCCQTCGIVGVARWMKSTGAGGRGRRRRCRPESSSSRSPLRRLHGAQAVTTFSQIDSPPLRARDHVVERQPPGGGAAVDAAPAVTGEERAPRDLPLDRPRDADVLDEPDHVRPGVRVGRGAQGLGQALEDLGLALPDEHVRAPNRADVQRLVTRVQDEDLLQVGTKRTSANRGYSRPWRARRLPVLPARGRSGRGRGRAP